MARRVCSSTSGPLIRTPSWAPRPEPTRSAVGVASPSAHGHAMISTETAAANANAGSEPVASQKPSVATAIAITIGTKTAETRSASRCTGALPACASVTSRPIWATAVSAPTWVARTTRRPETFTVAPIASSPGPDVDGDALAGEQRRVDGRLPGLDHAVGGDLLPRPDDEQIADAQLLDGHAPLLAVRADEGDVLRAELEQRLQRRAGAALGARLEVAAHQDEDRHNRGDLEVELPLVEAERDQRPAPAARVPIEISVSIVAAPCRAFTSAARWKGQPPQRTTGVASSSETHPNRRTEAEGSSRGRARAASAPPRRSAAAGARPPGSSAPPRRPRHATAKRRSPPTRRP